jgi:hypothetical protein
VHTIVNWIRRHPTLTVFLAAGLFYLVCTFFYQGPALTDCSNALTGGPGDESAGLIWLNSIDHVHPFWSFTHVTNYPWGEHLDQPVYASGAAGYLLYWVLALLAGSVCGYNLLCAVGFLFSALIMFGFIRWLTRRNSIALLAGYAFAFTPYLQIKTGVHPSYVYEGLFVGVIWLFLMYWKRPRTSLAVWLGILTALTFYWDAYFVLIAGILWAGLLAGALVYELIDQREWDRVWRRLKFGSLAALTFIMLLLPLAYVRLHYSGQINSVVSRSRNAVKQDAKIYSAHPLEYLRPAESNPVLKALIPGYAARRRHHMSNPAEYTINLSLTLILIVIIAALTLLYRRLAGRRIPIRSHLPVDALLLLACVLAAGGLAFAFSLPPELAHHKMPTWYLTSLIAMWRVFARLYILVHLSLVVTAAVALAYLATLVRGSGLKVTTWFAIFILVALEYQTFVPPRQAWSYTTNVPPLYYRLHDRAGVHVVAEYPLDEPAVTVWPTFYTTYQRVTGKTMINAYEAASPEAPIREAIRTLGDPQSLPSLRALGTDTLITHGSPKLSLPGLQLIDYQGAQAGSQNIADPSELYPIAVYKILPGTSADYVVAPEAGFVPPQTDGPLSYNYAGSDQSTIELLPLPGSHVAGLQPACFNIRTNATSSDPMTIRQGNRVLWSGNLTSSWQTVNFNAPLGTPIEIHLARPTGYFLHNLGC